MTKIMTSAARTFASGILLVAPITILLVLLIQAVKFAASLLDPLAKVMSTETIGDKLIANLFAGTIIIGSCFFAGVFAGTALGTSLADRLEHLILRRIPGFTLLKSMTHGFVGVDSGTEVKVALAWIEESWVPAFVMEQHANGLSTVFVPSAPTPAAGTIYYLPDARVKLLDVSISTAVACVTRLGIGSHALLADVKSGPPDNP